MAGKIADGEDELSEINVTPFIDVMLVLLIVFMVAAPLSTVDVQVNLPASSAAPAERPVEPLWLTVTAERRLLLGEAEIDTALLVAALDAKTAAARETPIYLRADQALDYGALMDILDALRAGGYLKVALVGLEAAP